MNLQPQQKLLNYTRSKHLGLILGLVACLLLKNFTLFQAGQFVSEDSFFFYATAYNKSWIGSVTTPYAGYLHVLPMILAELLWNVPFQVLPWVNFLVALCLSTFLLSWLYTPYCRRLIPSDAHRFTCVILIACTPFQPNLGMLLGLHWYLSFFLGVFLLSDLPEKPLYVCIGGCIVVIAAWSSPASIVLIPFAIHRCWTLKTKNAHYIPLAFAAASIAYIVTILLVFKPNSGQPNMAAPLTAIAASFKMLHEGILLQSIFGTQMHHWGGSLFASLLKLTVVGTVISALWLQRRRVAAKYAIAFLFIGMSMLGLTMLRGHQSMLILEAEGLHSERYLTTPTFYLFTALFILFSQAILRTLKQGRATQVTLSFGVIAWLCLLVYKSPPLHGDTPIESAFPHHEKARILKQYERRFAEGGQAETLALPGWTPVETMRLKIGGGRLCKTPTMLTCIFGDELIQLSADTYTVSWLGTFKIIDEDWLQHHEWGLTRILGYQGGFYWFQDANRQRYLSGPAIYPRRFEYPIPGAIRIRQTN